MKVEYVITKEHHEKAEMELVAMADEYGRVLKAKLERPKPYHYDKALRNCYTFFVDAYDSDGSLIERLYSTTFPVDDDCVPSQIWENVARYNEMKDRGVENVSTTLIASFKTSVDVSIQNGHDLVITDGSKYYLNCDSLQDIKVKAIPF